MTRRSSLRARAQEIYGEMAAAKETAGEVRTACPLPNPPPQATEGTGSTAGGETSLTAQNLTEKVRALYEGSAVPVAKIATVAGVTERTIYKYVSKHGWKRRYRLSPCGAAAARANRGRRLRPAEGFAPAKGAGGRFVRRADKDKPFAAGLKATDPEAAARAAAACRQAEGLAQAAEREAEEARRFEECMCALTAVNRALEELTAYSEQRKTQHAAQPAANDPLERALVVSVAAAVEWWQSCKWSQRK